MPSSRPSAVRIIGLERRADLNLSYGIVQRKRGKERFDIRIGTDVVSIMEGNLEFLPSFPEVMIDMSMVDPSEYIKYSKEGVLVDKAIKDRLRIYPKNTFDMNDLVKLGYVTPGDTKTPMVVLDKTFYQRMAKLRAEEQDEQDVSPTPISKPRTQSVPIPDKMERKEELSRAHRAAYEANVEAEHQEARVVEARRRARAIGSRDERTHRVVHPTVHPSKPKQGKKKSKKNADMNRIHEVHILPAQREIRSARFDAAQEEAHMEAEARKARAHADTLKKIASDLSKEYAASVHVVPSLSTMNEVFRSVM